MGRRISLLVFVAVVIAFVGGGTHRAAAAGSRASVTVTFVGSGTYRISQS